MNTNKKAPKLRFKGFTDDWEQHKLSEITARVTRKNGSQSDLPLTISAQDGLVDQRKYFNRQVASRDMSNYYLIKKGEFAYNKSYSEGYPFGAVKRLDYYDMGALSTLYILFEITDKNISSDFIVSYYMTHLWHKEISKQAAEGARNHGLLNISTEDFFDSELNIPNSIEEQVKIGNFIKQFDKFINLYQRKLDKMKLNKRVLLQKLFPQNGCMIPEVRFKGFTDAWEQRELSSLTEYIGTGKSRFVIKEYGEYAILGSTNVIGYDDSYDYDGNFILTARVGANAGQLYRYSGKVKITDNTVFLMSDGSQFIFYTLTHFDLRRLSFGTGQPLVKSSELQKLKLCVPVSKSEQEKIGEIFNNIDNIITLHQCKLDCLISIKKALLQQLFV